MDGWIKKIIAVSDYLDFAKSVLRIPEAHEMIARYTVLDEDAKRLILLRPYQIHAIEAIVKLLRLENLVLYGIQLDQEKP